MFIGKEIVVEGSGDAVVLDSSDLRSVGASVLCCVVCLRVCACGEEREKVVYFGEEELELELGRVSLGILSPTCSFLGYLVEGSTAQYP